MHVCSLACAPRVHAPAGVATAGVGPFLFFLVCSSFGSDLLRVVQLLSPSFVVFVTMAPKVRGERRAAERADREAAERRVRQRLDDVEQRIEEAEAMHRNHDQRISFQESPQRLVLRGFACVGEFFRARGEDFALAKRAFIGAFFQELKEHCGPEVTHHIEEAEGLLADRNGWGVVGAYPKGGSLDELPDGLLRLQPGFVGSRSGYLLCSSAIYLQRPRQLFQDRVRRIDAKGQREGQEGWQGQGEG